jgi:hypothetical protein
MSDSADCYAATAARGLTAWVLVNRLVAITESRHRSASSAETANCSLVIDESELANSRQTDLGLVSG